MSCLSEETTIQRLAMALALALLANHQRIEEVIVEYGGNQEKGFALNVVVHQDLIQVLEEDIFSTQQNKALSAAICESNVPWGETQPPTALILHDDYKLMHSWATHRSEEHTSELQSQSNLVCRLLLEKKKKIAH